MDIVVLLYCSYNINNIIAFFGDKKKEQLLIVSNIMAWQSLKFACINSAVKRFKQNNLTV